MHEFSTAVNIIEAVKRTARSHGVKKVTAIKLQIGKLSMLNQDQLLFGLEIAAKDTVAEGAKVLIEDLPIRIRCHQCGKESTIAEEGTLFEILTSLTCPKCHEKDVVVIQGRECVIKDIQAVVEEAAD